MSIRKLLGLGFLFCALAAPAQTLYTTMYPPTGGPYRQRPITAQAGSSQTYDPRAAVSQAVPDVDVLILLAAGWTTINPAGGGGSSNSAPNSLRGNNTGSTAPTADLTVSQINTLLGTGSSTSAPNSVRGNNTGSVATTTDLTVSQMNTLLGSIGLTDTQTLTNKTMDGASNTFLNLPASQLVGSLNVSSLSGVMGVANGGTGLASGTSGSALYYSGTTTLTSGTLPFGAGGTGLATASIHTTPVSSGTAWIAKTLPDCTDTSGQHINYTQSTDTYSCGNSAGGSGVSLSDSPTWTGVHTWSLTEPRLKLNSSGAGTDLKLWDWDLAGTVLTLRTRTDADAAGVNIMQFNRGATTALSSINVGNATSNNTVTFLGTGTVTTNGQMIVTNASPLYKWNASGQGTDQKIWQGSVSGLVWTLQTRTDASGAGTNAIAVTRGTTTAVSDISLGNATNNNTFNVLGTGTETFAGTTINLSGITASSAAQTGTVCLGAGGSLTYDTTTTCLLSARRFKDEIAPLNTGLQEVLKLRPVSFMFKKDVNGEKFGSDANATGPQVGFIAEDVQAIDSRLVTVETDGQLHSVRYQQMTALLAKAVQELNAKVERQQWEIYALGLWCAVLSMFQLLRRRK